MPLHPRMDCVRAKLVAKNYASAADAIAGEPCLRGLSESAGLAAVPVAEWVVDYLLHHADPRHSSTFVDPEVEGNRTIKKMCECFGC